MTPNITLVLVVGVLFSTGVYLLLARSVVRALIGFLLLSNGANILFLIASGRAGRAPIVGRNDGARMSDPLPQALVLTAIVIGLCMTAFMLALAHRSWQLSETDVLADDVEDTRIHRRATDNDMSESDYQDRDRPEDEPMAPHPAGLPVPDGPTTYDDHLDDNDDAHEDQETQTVTGGKEG
ncbi:Na(+)/H(+) antiporter subunit C [Luteipulveratus sp. YIM 133132]|uniref:Na(+)/H(+) antiporter subunit C n=1 Tax=Luteipulveratus flavus TaxID=3031728 RepID=UPI0023AFB390|nr:Na(+)/H(+) antiporter subunit C [Luteipulveratus sp. YIM 133132]MDE9364266.1 Na(+)/H(+) antiporter subunit C [Luteipulveratus sp. YIM 133132]